MRVRVRVRVSAYECSDAVCFCSITIFEYRRLCECDREAVTLQCLGPDDSLIDSLPQPIASALRLHNTSSLMPG